MSVCGRSAIPIFSRDRSCIDGLRPAASHLSGLEECQRLVRVSQVTIPLIGVVDDDEALCSSLADLLRSAGYRSEAFTSSEALLGHDDLSSFDCVVADVHMPGIGGLGLVGELRQRGVATPVILITALSHVHLDEQAKSVGAFCLLRKPFKTSVLLASVERSVLNDMPPE